MRSELKFGFIAGAAMGAWLLVEYALGLHSKHLSAGAVTHWGTEVILVVAMYLLLRGERARLNRYWLPVWEGVLHGTIASLVASLVFYTISAAYVFFINPDWPDLMLADAVASMRAAAVPEEEIRAYARFFRWCFTPAGLAVFVVSTYTLGGGLASAVLTLWINWRHKERADAG